MLLFIANYRRELRMKANIRKKRKIEITTEFAERMKKIEKEARAALRRAQEEMKQQVDKRRRKVGKWDKVILNMKDLLFKERLAKKLVNQYIGSYFIEEVVSTNVVKLWLPISMRIHSVVNISYIVQYKK